MPKEFIYHRYSIVFMQGEEADEMIDYLEKYGERKTLTRMIDDYDYKGAVWEETPMDSPGQASRIYAPISGKNKGYELIYSTKYGYIGLDKIEKEQVITL